MNLLDLTFDIHEQRVTATIKTNVRSIYLGGSDIRQVDTALIDTRRRYIIKARYDRRIIIRATLHQRVRNLNSQVRNLFITDRIHLGNLRHRRYAGAVTRPRVANIVRDITALVLSFLDVDSRLLADIHIRLNTNVTHGGTAVTEEDVNIILLTRHQLTALSLKDIQVYITRSSQVRTANINSKLVINKHPNVVIAAEAETLAPIVGKVGMRFKAVMLVAFTIPTIGYVRGTTIRTGHRRI